MLYFFKIAAISVMVVHGAYASYSTPKKTEALNIGSLEKPSSIPTMTAMPESFCGRPSFKSPKNFSFEGYRSSPETTAPSIHIEKKLSTTPRLSTSTHEHHRFPPLETSSPQAGTPNNIDNRIALLPIHTPTPSQEKQIPTDLTEKNNLTDGENFNDDDIFHFDQ